MRLSIQIMMRDLDDVPKGKLAASYVKKQVPVDTGHDIKLVGYGPDDQVIYFCDITLQDLKKSKTR